MSGLSKRYINMKVVKAPSEALALTNCLLVHPTAVDPSVNYVLVDDKYPFTVKYVTHTTPFFPHPKDAFQMSYQEK